MRQRTREVALSLAAASIVVAGCSGSTETAETAPTPGTNVVESTTTGSLSESTDATAVTTSVETDPPTTPAIETTAPEVTGAPDEPFLTDVPGRLVDSAPNVNSPGEIYELMPKLWLFIPSEPDPNDPNVIQPSPEDAEILAAYARYRAALYQDSTQNPLPASPSAEVRQATSENTYGNLVPLYAQRSSARQHFELGDGDLYRPVVLQEPRTDSRVTVYDCVLSSSRWVNDADGSIAAGSSDQLIVGGIEEVMVRNDAGEWVYGGGMSNPDACVE